MANGTTPRGSKNSPPQDFAQTTPPAQFDQFSVMQSIMEIQKDVTRLVLATDSLVAEVKELKAETAATKAKVGRAEAIVVAGGALVVVFAVFLWWLFAAPITYLRDQMIVQQPSIAAPVVEPGAPPSL